MTNKQAYAGLRKKLVAVDDVEMGGVCEVTVLRNPDGPEAAEAISSLLKALQHVEKRVYSLMRSQEEDVKVNGPTHPGLLEPMQELLRDLHKEVRAALNSDAPQSTGGAAE